jgi:hypothetical protein
MQPYCSSEALVIAIGATEKSGYNMAVGCPHHSTFHRDSGMKERLVLHIYIITWQLLIAVVCLSAMRTCQETCSCAVHVSPIAMSRLTTWRLGSLDSMGSRLSSCLSCYPSQLVTYKGILVRSFYSFIIYIDLLILILWFSGIAWGNVLLCCGRCMMAWSRPAAMQLLTARVVGCPHAFVTIPLSWSHLKVSRPRAYIYYHFSNANFNE